MCVLKTKMCCVFHTVGSCKWCFAHETSSAWPIALPCHVACQLFHHASFAHSIWSICWRFRDEPPRILSSRSYITTQRIWKALQWHQTCGPAANTAGNFLRCPPTAHLLPSNQHWVSGWGVTAELVGTHPWPLHERLTKRQEPFLWILRKVHKSGDRQSKLPLLNMWKHFRFSHHSAGCTQRALLRRIVIVNGHFARLFFDKIELEWQPGSQQRVFVQRSLTRKFQSAYTLSVW